jgi:hypothetical protein
MVSFHLLAALPQVLYVTIGVVTVVIGQIQYRLPTVTLIMFIH